MKPRPISRLRLAAAALVLPFLSGNETSVALICIGSLSHQQQDECGIV